jgi:hypothetical protein
MYKFNRLHVHCLQAQQAFQAAYPQLAEQHSQVLAAALNNSAGTFASSAADPALSYSSKLCNSEPAAAALAQLERALVAASNNNAAASGAATTASQVGLTAAPGSASGDSSAAAAPAASGPVQALLQLAAAANGGLEAVDKVSSEQGIVINYGVLQAKRSRFEVCGASTCMWACGMHSRLMQLLDSSSNRLGWCCQCYATCLLLCFPFTCMKSISQWAVALLMAFM